MSKYQEALNEMYAVVNEDYNKWLQSNYELIKNDFGKKIVYKGNDWIIIGVEIKEKEKNVDYDNGTWELESEFYLKIKKSFEEETIIKLSDYLLSKKQLMLKIVNNEYLIEQQHLENKRGMQRVYDLERETRDLKDELKKMEEVE